MKCSPKIQEDAVILKRELDAVKVMHEALLAVAPDRRGPILRSVAILLQIHVPQD